MNTERLPDQDDDTSQFRAASLSSVRWVSLARVVSEIVGIGSAVVLARLIAPAEFGRVAIALGVATIALSLAWVGFASPLVQMRSIDTEDVEVATLLSLVAGAVLTVLILLIATYVVEPVFGERVAYLLKLASPVFILSALGTVPNALLQRQLAFRRLSQIDIFSTAAGPATSIALAALAGLNADAIVLGMIATAMASTIGTLVAHRPTRPRWHPGRARGMASFGLSAGLAVSTWTIFANIDYAIIGARLPARDVGIYWRGYQLGVEYQSKITSILQRVAFPLYSRAPTFDEMRSLRGRMVRVHTIVLYPILTTLVALAPEAVRLLFGSQWEEATFPTQVLAVAGMATVAAAGTVQLAFAAGHARTVLYFFLVLLGGYALVISIASGYGLRAVVVAAAAYQVVLLGAQFYFLETRLVGIPLRETWSALVPALVCSLISLAVAYPTASALESGGLADVIVILTAGSLAVAVYAATLRILFPSSWQEFFRLVRALAKRG